MEEYVLREEAAGTLWTRDMEEVKVVTSKEEAIRWVKENPWLRDYVTRGD